MDYLGYIIAIVMALAVGSFLGYLARQTIAKKQLGTVESKLNKMIEEAKQEAKETLFKAKDKAVQIIEEAEKQERERKMQLLKMEERLEKREENLDRKTEEAERKIQDLTEKVEKVKQIKQELEGFGQKQRENLERISGLSQEDAKKELLDLIEKEHQQVLLERIKKLEDEGRQDLEKKARNIITLAMQRYAASQAAEISTTAVELPSDDLKGRIIGKEGRNIKTLEKLTGVEVIVDDTPGAIVISGFDPIRRQIAKLTLEKLISDGRIQPARIEEMVEKAKEEIGNKIQEAGEAAVYDTGVAGLDPKLIKILGRLRFRTSYGQNVLLHSVEVAHLAAAIASEIGADASLVKKAGLLHDIGKAIDHEIQGSHTEIGKMILEKFNISPDIIKAVVAHHEEYPHESIESVIVQVADAISGARPGARKDTLEAYLKRLEELEKIANSFEGVEKTFAIQAGREIRVFVQPEKLDDLAARKLARQIADRIQEELKYPGEIKVNVIRETRMIEYAR
ncbi:MAG: ribonuclease Y [Candidatus Portnoybacteria bacterium CG_4_8_14_3_um_filter_40_10]|uniref:Ribonuclease Y n=3 Tax=Candidatus Portnoyibacteriota TaxID=1817913 RepID=A0A2M7IJJ1_9BACT|nr:MAG: ribonuclease Y [Candidatus Portnoybacteria bacterium CG_4_8_14_3_um_filter_40_10]PJA64753.1 MAG: ribonuclease Y [Candidatus Portnoybacteria bacterium CG_4_9_14_3_um_filter_40_10]